MNHVDQLLEQQKMIWICTHARPDKDAIERLLGKRLLDDGLGGSSEIDIANLSVVTASIQVISGTPECRTQLLCV
jgi:nanoRNase/pAp phosphatase (c-di-AMP/oligoRNAs hydrolase)